MSIPCLSEEKLLELYYGETQMGEEKAHLAGCAKCQQLFHQLCQDLVSLELTAPDAGYSAVEETLKIIAEPEKTDAHNEIMTPEEVADWFKVSRHNIMNMLHLLPHFIIDGEVRFERQALKEYLQGQNARAASKAPDQPRHNVISLLSRKAS